MAIARPLSGSSASLETLAWVTLAYVAEASIETPVGSLAGYGIARRPLPAAFCWTKYGSEAGESPETIFARKEEERQRNDGLFLWGIGNALGPSMRQLINDHDRPQVLFSPMKASPLPQDVAPPNITLWDSGIGLNGGSFRLPEHSVVTSRSGRRGFHWALVCRRDASFLEPHHGFDDVAVERIRNLRSGSVVGSSQVTAVVAHDSRSMGARSYPVTFSAELSPPYLVRLTDGVTLPGSASGLSLSELLAIRGASFDKSPQQPTLF